MPFFKYFTPITYWLLCLMWSFIFLFYINRLISQKITGRLHFTLIIILSIDAFRTLFESVYFGAWYTSLVGFLPKAVYSYLVRPEIVFIPKVINVIAAVVVIVILLYRWIPQEESEKEYTKKLIDKQTKELSKTNVKLNDEIIEHKRTEEELRENEEKYRTLFERESDAIFIYDPNTTHILDANKATSIHYGYSHDELIGMSCLKFSAEVEKSASVIEKTLENDETNIPIRSHCRKDGSLFHVEINNYAIILKGKKMMYAICKDISKQKQAEEENRRLEMQLQQSQKMESIGTLAGGIAHDFNNILFPIVGHTEMLLEDVPEDGPFRDSLNEIYTSSLRARDLVKQILTFSRQGNHELKFMKMVPIIKEALKLIRSTIPTTISIRENLNPDCGVVKADPTQIHQIIMNLTTNAFHAMEETGGELEVNLKEIELGQHDLTNPDMTPGLYACLSIADTGKGIKQDIMNKIFDPFFTTKEIGKGTGIGLSVVHGIVKSMNGQIHVHSEPGKGTECHVCIPVVRCNTFEKQESLPNEPILGGSERILLVDDEEGILTMEELALERLGYRVTSKTSSVEALETFKATPDKFDLVITDMAMPNMPGNKLAIALIKIRPEIPILICTGFSETMIESKIKLLGIKGFLLKPVIIKDMAKKIRDILDNI